MKSWQFITPTPLSCPVQPGARPPRIYNTFTCGTKTFRIFASRTHTHRQFSNRRQGRSSLTGNGDKLFQPSSVSRVFLHRRLQWGGGGGEGREGVTIGLRVDCDAMIKTRDSIFFFFCFFSDAFQVTVEKLIRWWFFDRIRSRLMETWFPTSYARTWFRLVLNPRSNEIGFYKLFLSIWIFLYTLKK